MSGNQGPVSSEAASTVSFLFSIPPGATIWVFGWLTSTKPANTSTIPSGPRLPSRTRTPRYQDLLSWGVEFEKDDGGEPRSFRENAPLEALKLQEGRRVPNLLRKQALKSQVDIMDRIMITDLIKQDGRVIGACGFHIWSGDWYVFEAKA